jgi:hypothetical protein
MSLLVTYVVTVVIGQAIVIGIGLMVERYYSSAASLWVALSLYFMMFWLAWQIAVRLTEPRSSPRDRRHP